MADVQAINAGNITTIGAGIIIALVVIGILLSLVITAILGRVIILVLVIVLAAFVWQQRGHIKDEFTKKACGLNSTFFGIHVDAPDDVKQA
ncbi:MAG: hypothetical protein M3Y06_09845, partial [Actinomycetota bacterium]|nr:hypothetical protein [Actinomycetota bacterium]